MTTIVRLFFGNSRDLNQDSDLDMSPLDDLSVVRRATEITGQDAPLWQKSSQRIAADRARCRSTP
jgi:hypothetical protein